MSLWIGLKFTSVPDGTRDGNVTGMFIAAVIISVNTSMECVIFVKKFFESMKILLQFCVLIW